MKIYNEIVIDMNPESSTFEETIYEDSFEYSGDMMLLDWTGIVFTETDQYGITWTAKYDIGWFDTIKGVEIFKDGVSVSNEPRSYNNRSQASSYVKDYIGKYEPTTEELNVDEDVAGSTDWGAADITQDMFISTGPGGEYSSISPAGEPRTVQEIYNTLDSLLPGITGQPLVEFINETLPKWQAPAQEEIDFLAQQYGGSTGLPNDPSTPEDESRISFEDSLTGRTAGVTLAGADITRDVAKTDYELDVKGAGREKGTMLEGLQESAYQVGGDPAVIGGIRGQMRGKKKLKKSFESGMDKYRDLLTGYESTWEAAQGRHDLAQDTYDISKAGAEYDYTTGLYDLETTGVSGYETDVLKAMPDLYFEDPASGPETTSWESFNPVANAREGGKVPTFSEVLSRIPDAGGS